MIDPALAEYAETPDRFAPIPEGSSVTREDDGRICIIQGPIWASISGAQFDEHELDDVLAHVHDRVAPDKRQTLVDRPDGAARRTSSHCSRSAASCSRRTGRRCARWC